MPTGTCVSIPLHRESVSKVNGKNVGLKLTLHKSFDSLRSGKCIQRCRPEARCYRDGNMFRFPSPGKVSPKGIWNGLGCGDGISFDSLRPGKCLQSFRHIVLPSHTIRFRFPCTGKVSPKRDGIFYGETLIMIVSIPFDRESVSKEGKSEEKNTPDKPVVFPFPSTGKVSPKRLGKP